MLGILYVIAELTISVDKGRKREGGIVNRRPAWRPSVSGLEVVAVASEGVAHFALDLSNVKHILRKLGNELRFQQLGRLVSAHVVSHWLHDSELYIGQRCRDVRFQPEEDRVTFLNSRVLGGGVKHNVGFVILRIVIKLAIHKTSRK